MPPRPLDRVSDFAGVLSGGDRSRVEERLASIEQGTSNQFVVAIFPSLEGDSLEDFSIRLAEAWKVGHKGRDNGLFLLIFTQDRKMRIEVGYGLEGAIPDVLAGRVIRDVIGPRFRQGDYAGGILAGIDSLDAASRGEFKPLAQRKGAAAVGILPVAFIVIVFVILAFANRAAHIEGRGRGRRGGFWWFGPWGGGGGGFGGWSGGSGGGFSGGGGGFGGGGASGDW